MTPSSRRQSHLTRDVAFQVFPQKYFGAIFSLRSIVDQKEVSVCRVEGSVGGLRIVYLEDKCEMNELKTRDKRGQTRE